jgi:hypothetical protein
MTVSEASPLVTVTDGVKVAVAEPVKRPARELCVTARTLDGPDRDVGLVLCAVPETDGSCISKYGL